MTNCKKCGKELSQGAPFCAHCGTPVHSEKQIFSGKKEVEPESQLSRISRKKRPHGRRNHTRKWLIGAGALFVLLLAAMAGFFLLNDGDKDQASTAGQEETEVEPPKMTQSDVSALFPGWKMIQQEMICLKGAYYHVLAVAKNEESRAERLKLPQLIMTGSPKTMSGRLCGNLRNTRLTPLSIWKIIFIISCAESGECFKSFGRL